MQIEKIKVSEIIPYEDNAKLHPERQVQQIKASINEFGFNDPIAIDENNVVIEGNGRLTAPNNFIQSLQDAPHDAAFI